MSNSKAQALQHERRQVHDAAFVELKVETPYLFVSAEQLLRDFWKDVDEWS
jgi:hypothetical protein